MQEPDLEGGVGSELTVPEGQGAGHLGREPIGLSCGTRRPGSLDVQGAEMGSQRGGTGWVTRCRGVRSWACPADLLSPQSGVGQKCRSWEMSDEKYLGGNGMGSKADVLGGMDTARGA